MPGLFSSPSDNAAQAAQTTASADNAEIGQEEQYVNAAEGQLRSAIAGLGPNPYFSPPSAPAPANPNNTATFTQPTPQATGGNLFASPQPASGNVFAVPATRQPQPVARAPVSGAPVQTAAISRQQGPAAS